MKKIALSLILIMLISICACGEETDTSANNTEINSNTTQSESTSNTSSVISDFELPERDDPTNPSSNSSSDKNFNASHDPDDQQSNLTVTKNLDLEVEKTSYKSSVFMINIILHNEKGVFNYYTDFFLQKYENGNWEYCTTLTENIEYKYYIATSQSNIEFITYDLRKNYAIPLSTGTYRFIQESDYGKLVSNTFEIVDNIYTEEEQPQQ